MVSLIVEVGASIMVRPNVLPRLVAPFATNALLRALRSVLTVRSVTRVVMVEDVDTARRRPVILVVVFSMVVTTSQNGKLHFSSVRILI